MKNILMQKKNLKLDFSRKELPTQQNLHNAIFFQVNVTYLVIKQEIIHTK